MQSIQRDVFDVCLPVMPMVRYIADITPTEKAMLTERNWPLVSLLVLTCAAAEQPNICQPGGTRRKDNDGVRGGKVG